MSELRERRPSPRRNLGNGSGHVKIDILRSESSNLYAKLGKRRIKKKHKHVVLLVTSLLVVLTFILAVAFSVIKLDSNSSSPVKSSLREFYSKNDAKGSQQKIMIPKSKDITRIPQTITLSGWSNLAASMEEYAKDHEDYEMKKADYGDIRYHSLSNRGSSNKLKSSSFQRKIDDAKGGAFDAKDWATGTTTTRVNMKYSHPEFVLTDGGVPMKNLSKDASYTKIQKFYDDDHVEVLARANDGKTRQPRACRAVEFDTLYFPTCNSFHEIDVGRPYDDPNDDESKPRPVNQLARSHILSNGYYRDVWVVEDNPWVYPSQYRKEKENRPKEKLGVLNEKSTAELVVKGYRSMVIKTLRYKHKMSDESFDEIRKEAIIMERLTKSPRIISLYGHCGFSVSAEVVPIELEERIVLGEGYADPEDVEERNKDGLRPYNNFTAEEKLDIALQMAESIADLHGFEDGIIVHDDIQLCQWMTTVDGKHKLGDFNRATIMQWDEINGQYCKFNNGKGYGNYRAPEEFAGEVSHSLSLLINHLSLLS